MRGYGEATLLSFQTTLGLQYMSSSGDVRIDSQWRSALSTLFFPLCTGLEKHCPGMVPCVLLFDLGFGHSQSDSACFLTPGSLNSVSELSGR